MTTSTLSPTPVSSPGRGSLSFGGILRSEWIKLRTVRSTVWCYAIIIVLTVLFGILFASTFQSDMAGDMSQDDHQSFGVQATTLGIGFSQLVASVLGVLVISGEYGTGMIRSTLTAVPRRTPALLAKAMVFGVVTLVMGLIAIGVTTVATAPLLSGSGIKPDFADPQLLFALGGGALYLALVGVLSLAIGAIVRNSAGGIAASLGLLLVLPTVLQIFSGVTNAVWVQNLVAFLPSVAGERMLTYGAEGSVSSIADGAMNDGLITLSSLQGGLVLGGWVVLLLLVATMLLKRRDV
jgi:ABC-2 type transport system permease protein